jgi:hypothetical protein
MGDAGEMSAGLTPKASVTIIEQKTVGDYESTILTADTTTALLEWLDGNGYDYNDKAIENFNYYIHQSGGGYYFVALKVDTSVARADTDGTLIGKLRPLEFAFAVTGPILPLRIMAGEPGQVSLTLFTLADRPLYVPGTTIEFSRRLTQDDFPAIACFTVPCPQPLESLSSYNSMGRWLMRHNIKLDPSKITRDVNLKWGIADGMTVLPGEGVRVFDPELVPPGVIKQTDPNRYTNLLDSTRLLRRGVRGNDVRDLQAFVNDSTGSVLVQDGIWGPLTDQAVRNFQVRYGLKVDGIVGPQTRGMIRLLVP